MSFLPRELAIAAFVAVAAQASLAAVFLLRPSEARAVDASSDAAKRPIAIAVSNRPLLKRGSAAPANAAATAASPPARSHVPQTSPNRAAPQRRAAAPALDHGSEQGSAEGTETDPLKARAADAYRSQLAGWFSSRFGIRGKVPFETLRTLQASVVVSTENRHVTGFLVTAPSGDSVFDEEITNTLGGLQASAVELPAPPPAYPEMLTETVPVTFRCTMQAQCE